MERMDLKPRIANKRDLRREPLFSELNQNGQLLNVCRVVELE